MYAIKLYKKILANRLKVILPSIISHFQSAIVPSRLIQENIIIAQELISHMKRKKKGKKGLMTIKIDIEKAFDTMELPFLIYILKSLGFYQILIQWISECISTVSYSILINEMPHDFFKPSRGLRKGDSISSSLFILRREVLSRLITREAQVKTLEGIKIKTNGHSITHLLTC